MSSWRVRNADEKPYGYGAPATKRACYAIDPRLICCVEDNNKALFLAAGNGYLDKVRNLLRIRNATSLDVQERAFYQAADHGHWSIVTLLYAQPGFNVTWLHNRLMYWAASRENKRVLQMLLKDTGGTIDTTVLRDAARDGNTTAVRVLLEHGADVHGWDDYALRLAAEKGHCKIVRLLLEYGADVHAENDWALSMAASNEHEKVVKVLLQHGADLDVIPACKRDFVIRVVLEGKKKAD